MKQQIDRHVEAISIDLDSLHRNTEILVDDLNFRTREIEILRWIDSQILEAKNRINADFKGLVDGIFREALARINSDLLNNGRCDFYLSENETMHMLTPVKASRRHPSILDLGSSQPKLDWKLLERKRYNREYTKSLFGGQFSGVENVYVEPLFIFNDILLGAFIVTEKASKKGRGQLHDKKVIDAFRGIFAQLKIAYRFLVEYQRGIRINGLWRLFAERDLSPHVCFNILAKQILRLMPEFGKLRLPSDVGVQLLMKRDEKTLRIRATTGNEHDIEVLLIEDSITGLVFKDGASPEPICIDPTSEEHRSQFQAYLGSEASPTRTELVVPLVFGGKTVGAINLESSRVNAVNDVQIKTLSEIAATVAPVAMGLEARLAQNREVQTAYSAIISQYLRDYSEVLKHEIGSPMSAITTDLDSIDLSIKDGPSDEKILRRELSSLSQNYKMLTASINHFANDLAAYGEIGPIELSPIIKECCRIANNKHDTETVGSNLAIAYEDTCRPTIYASMLLKPYILCLIENSILALKQRDENQKSPRKGIVTLKIFRHPNDKERVCLTIRDNGPGVTRDELEKLRKFQFGTRYRNSPGQGYGLAATQKYLSSIDGWMDIDSRAGSFFTVTLSFRLEKKVD